MTDNQENTVIPPPPVVDLPEPVIDTGRDQVANNNEGHQNNDEVILQVVI